MILTLWFACSLLFNLDLPSNFVVTFPNERLASIAASSVAVDDEVKAHRVSRTIVAEGSTVRVYVLPQHRH